MAFTTTESVTVPFHATIARRHLFSLLLEFDRGAASWLDWISTRAAAAAAAGGVINEIIMIRERLVAAAVAVEPRIRIQQIYTFVFVTCLHPINLWRFLDGSRS